eukprot:802806_1
MSTEPTNITSRTIIKSYPAPSELSMEEPHIKDVFAKPSKQRGHWCLKYNCHETGKQTYYEQVTNQLIYDNEIHDYLSQNVNILGVAFSKWWKKEYKCDLPIPMM